MHYQEAAKRSNRNCENYIYFRSQVWSKTTLSLIAHSIKTVFTITELLEVVKTLNNCTQTKHH